MNSVRGLVRPIGVAIVTVTIVIAVAKGSSHVGSGSGPCGVALLAGTSLFKSSLIQAVVNLDDFLDVLVEVAGSVVFRDFIFHIFS